MRPVQTLTPVLIAVALLSTSTLPAFATKNTGAFQQSIENNNSGGICTAYVDHYSNWLKKLNAAKDKSSRADAREEVNWAIEKGFANGCSWVDAV